MTEAFSGEFMQHPSLTGWVHAFTLRHPHIEVQVERAEAVARLMDWHCDVAQRLAPGRQLKLAEQVHGKGIAEVHAASPALTSGVDALMTRDPSVLLGIYVADCCAVYVVDHGTGAAGLAHSGKKGSELGILPQLLSDMQSAYGSKLADLTVQLSPCIRPPAYEVDFAASIREQCVAYGLSPHQVHDEELCTSRDPQRYYSYRTELGKTGRMLALLAAHA
jgi:polyphenol oxidase